MSIQPTLKGVRSPFSFLLIFLAFLLFGCRTDNKLGQEVQDDDSLIGLMSADTFELRVRTIPRDSILTDELDFIMIGSYQDPDFGRVQGNYYTQLRLSSENVDFGNPADLTLDSAVLSLFFESQDRGIAYGKKKEANEDLAPQTFEVYELQAPLDINSDYYNFSSVPLSASPIGSATSIVPNPFDSVSTATGREPAQLRIRLDEAWADQLLKADESVYNDQNSFSNFLYGIAVVPNNGTQTVGDGEILYFDPYSVYTRLRLFYQVKLTDTTSNSETYDFLINDSTAFFNQFELDNSGTPVEMALNDASIGEQRLYVQGMGGAAISLEIPYLQELGRNRKIAVNKAEITLTGDPAQVDYAFNPAFLLLRYDEDGILRFPLDWEEPGDHYGGRFDDFAKEVRFTITRQVQEILNDANAGINSNFGFLIVSGAEGSSVNRSVMNGTAPISGSAIRFNLIYTPL